MQKIMEMLTKQEKLALMPFIYGILLGEEECQLWEKIVTTQTESENYSDIYRNMHTDPAGKNKDSFVECIRIHLLIRLSSNAREKEKQYTKSGLKKPPPLI